MANKKRGEIEYKLGGKTFKIAPNFESIANVEEACGGILQVAQRISKGNILMKDVVGVLYHATAAAGYAVGEFNQFGNQVVKAGMYKFVKTVSDFCDEAMMGGMDEEEGEKVAEEKPKGEADAPKQI